MYSQIKRFILKYFPSVIHQNEALLRKIMALAYRGKAHQCPICSYKLSRFIQLENGDQLCPRCGSLGRSRRLYALLKGHVGISKVLHFSPPKSLKLQLEKWEHFDYVSSDYENEFEAELQLDITNINLPSESIDLIICYHVLEHIPNDMQAMRELYRILKAGGTAYIQTPFSKEQFLEDLSIISPEERFRLYGQADHVRLYTVEKLVERLESVGFNVERLEFAEEKNNRFGFKEEETVLLVKK
jgi:predicted SAM-dependent methyltransferase